jgi:hypothetical protein
MISLLTCSIPLRHFLLPSRNNLTFTLNVPNANRRSKGAKPGELLIEAARRNNIDLLQEVLEGAGSSEKAAILLNETKTVLGNYIYHEAALRGNCISPSSLYKLSADPKS